MNGSIIKPQNHPMNELPWPKDSITWRLISECVLDGQFDDADKSTRESVEIGLRSIKHPVAQRAVERLRVM